ncbi:MAG: ABC transporter ATP-binding protein [Rhodospirillales bacterium]
MTAPGLTIHDSELRFGGAIVFTGLNLAVRAGGWTAVLGASGVGKTSLLRLVAGLTDSATISGRVHAEDGQPLENRIAYMAQQDLLLPWLTALENVALPARLQQGRVSADEQRRALRYLHLVGLADEAAKLPAALSGGMRQRVALARTLFLERDIVLMDEPFSALDAISRFRLQAEAARLLEGKTVMLVTHDPMEALRLADSIYVLDGKPASVSQPIEMTGAGPRAVDDTSVISHYGQLMRLLGGEGAAA